VGAAVRRDADPDPADLFPEEAAALSPRAVPRRRGHFALGRAAAHDALRALALPASPVLRGERGEPLWPDGVVGSISHTAGIAVAVVGRSEQCAGIGVDLESVRPGLSVASSDIVCAGGEATWVTDGSRPGPLALRGPADTPGGTDAAALRLTALFGAKEAVFKALYPIERVWLGLQDAELTWLDGEQAFDAVLRVPAGAAFPAGFRLRVTCRFAEDMVLAATSVSARA
jgi:4'-phosphopantetheinyl transferase EntD